MSPERSPSITNTDASEEQSSQDDSRASGSDNNHSHQDSDKRDPGRKTATTGEPQNGGSETESPGPNHQTESTDRAGPIVSGAIIGFILFFVVPLGLGFPLSALLSGVAADIGLLVSWISPVIVGGFAAGYFRNSSLAAGAVAGGVSQASVVLLLALLFLSLNWVFGTGTLPLPSEVVQSTQLLSDILLFVVLPVTVGSAIGAVAGAVGARRSNQQESSGGSSDSEPSNSG